ncbi:MAG: FAD-dependent oxidoreductase [Chloroflexota bacterium]|nr:FAD-dependent oxidoreductase [Chloroflexota bacterium]
MEWNGKSERVVIGGGGLAGLAAAKRLVDAGYQVEVLEQRPILGGKVSSWRDADGDWVESGLHVFFGAYVEIFDLMRELGIYDNILWKEHVLTYTLSAGERFAFRTGSFPAPLHLLPAVVNNHYFSWGEKLSLAKALGPMLFGSPEYRARQDGLTYSEWHQKFGISDRMLQKMFMPMALALKFLPPEEMSAKIVLDVCGEFLRKPDASKMGFLKGSPQDYLIGPLADYLTARGVRIRTDAPIRAIHEGPGRRVTGFELASGEVVRGDWFTLALPVHKLNRLIPDQWRREERYFAGLSQFEGVPVITVQLWFDRQVTHTNNILFCPDGRIPVYADLANTTPDYAFGGKSRMEFCVAPARDLMDLPDDEIVRRTKANVDATFPDTGPQARIVKSTVVRIPQSVYWPKPGIDHLRPTQATPIPNLFLAGGYTTQDFYDSMEGAVASGRLAATALMDAASRMPQLSLADLAAD